MARTVKDTSLDKREARRRLSPRGKPYYRLLEEGLHLGYRKSNGRKGRPATGGKWVTRIYLGAQSYRVENIDGVADDFTDADGVAVLNFKQAQDKARERFQRSAHDEAGMSGPLTVADAMVDYLEALNHGGQNTYDAKKRSDAFIIPALGQIEVGQIKAKVLRNWLAALADKPPRVRSKKGHQPQHREDFDPDDEEAKRKRRASANRVLATLRAALNHAFHEGRVSSDTEWRRVKPFKEVDPTQIRFLSLAESKRLINASEVEFRPLVEAALLSGCRYGELCRLQVQDLNVDAGALSIRKSKSGKPRTVYLTPEGVQLFQTLAVGRTGRDLLMRHKDGRAWGRSEQHRPMMEACERAKIVPHYTFHELRHTYASLLARAGVPMKVISDSLGHSTTAMTEKHYAFLAPSHVADTIRKHLPKFGLKKSNVVGLR
jgi:integrase